MEPYLLYLLLLFALFALSATSLSLIAFVAIAHDKDKIALKTVETLAGLGSRMLDVLKKMTGEK
jgi:hypothetical protein